MTRATRACGSIARAMKLLQSDLFNAILDGLHKELTRLRVKNIPREVRVSSANEFRTVFLAHFNAWRARTASGRVVLLLDEVDKYFPRPPR